MKRLIVLTAIMSLFFFEPSTAYSQVVVVKPARPKVVVVKAPRARRGYIWVDGTWKWNRRRGVYVWSDGFWIKKRPGRRYVAGRWVVVGRGHRWVAGHWVRA